MTDRFDLEEQIQKCWIVTSDVELLCRNVMDQDMTVDEISNVLIGIKSIYDLKFEELWRTFETMVRERQFTSMTNKVQYVQLDKEKVTNQIKQLAPLNVWGPDYSAGYKHGRDDAATIIETS